MSKINNGGPAFPCEEFEEMGFTVQHPSAGMSLRDWFAGQALAAIIEADGAQFFRSSEAHARVAYAHADAMIAERERSTS